MEMCLLQLLCQDSFSPIQIVQDYSRRQDQNFQETARLPNCRTLDPSFHAIQLNPIRHSIKRNSNCHHIESCLRTRFLWNTAVQILLDSESAPDFDGSSPDKPFVEPLPLPEYFDIPLDFSFVFLRFFLCSHCWTMICHPAGLCQTIACSCLCVHLQSR